MARKGTKLSESIKQKMKEARKNNQVCIQSQSFTIKSDTYNWIAEFPDGGTPIYHSKLAALCVSILERKLKKTEVRDIQGLKDAIEKATNEICFITPKLEK